MILWLEVTSQNFNSRDNILDQIYTAVFSAYQAAAMVKNMDAGMKGIFRPEMWNVSGGECERRGIRVRLGGNSYPITAMSDVHHCYS